MEITCTMPLLGHPFPNIKAQSTSGPISLPEDSRGKWLVFFSHPADFTPVCTTEFVAFQNRLQKFAALNAMLVFDAVIFNPDRHFGNFGFMVDNKTNKITASAPLFDHGNALFNYAGRDDLENFAALEAYAGTLMPCTYDDFTGTAKKALTPELREGLRHLLDFKFKKHPRYNLPDKRLKLLEQFVQKQARVLLEK